MTFKNRNVMCGQHRKPLPATLPLPSARPRFQTSTKNPTCAPTSLSPAVGSAELTLSPVFSGPLSISPAGAPPPIPPCCQCYPRCLPTPCPAIFAASTSVTVFTSSVRGCCNWATHLPLAASVSPSLCLHPGLLPPWSPPCPKTSPSIPFLLPGQ